MTPHRDLATRYRREAMSGFLRNRRAASHPDPASPAVDPLKPRRVPGMRREEVAAAAHISVDYYTKLEQGRAAHPSLEILDAVALALSLDDLEGRYLRALGAPQRQHSAGVHGVDSGRSTASAVSSEDGGSPPSGGGSGAEMAALDLRRLGSLMSHARMVHLLADDLTLTALDEGTGRVLHPDKTNPPVTFSLLEYLFLDPVAREVYVNWAAKAAEVVGLAHTTLAHAGPTRELHRAIRRVSELSAPFRYLWKKYEPAEKTSGVWRLKIDGEAADHRYLTVRTPDYASLSLVVYTQQE